MMIDPVSTTVADDPEVVELFFEAGLVGMPDFRHFRLEPFQQTLLTLVCIEEPALEFVAVPAEAVRPGMTEALVAKGIVAEDERLIVLLAVHGEPAAITANLAGPLAVKLEDGTARQLVLESDEYPLRAPVAGVV